MTVIFVQDCSVQHFLFHMIISGELTLYRFPLMCNSLGSELMHQVNWDEFSLGIIGLLALNATPSYCAEDLKDTSFPVDRNVITDSRAATLTCQKEHFPFPLKKS